MSLVMVAVLGLFLVTALRHTIPVVMGEAFHDVVLLLASGLLTIWVAMLGLVAVVSRRLTTATESLRHLAERDALTGLVNRAAFAERVEDVLRGGAPAAVALIDLQRFHDVNDTLGHSTGDMLLQLIAGRLRDRVRGHEVVGRMGGDEFGLLLPGQTTAEGARRRVTELMAVFVQPYPVDGFTVEVAGTAGVTLSKTDVGRPDAEQMLQEADIALYQATLDASPVVVYDPARNHFTRDRLELASHIRRGLGAGQFVVAYQPQLNVRTGRVHSLEALLRWDHPTKGELLPEAFLEVAQETDLIRALTAFVLDEVLGQMRRWRQAGMRLRVAINLSARDCANPALPVLVDQALARHDVAPEDLTLELTESAMLTNSTVAEGVLRAVAKTGVEVAVDDFGTGYASLAYVRRMPLSELKIDRSLVQRLHDEGPDADVIRFTTDLGRRLHLRVVAEGVESRADVVALSALGCHVIQGYAVARPMDPAAATRWLQAATVTGRPGHAARAPALRVPRRSAEAPA